jgi:DNA-binding transcriptional ArsR family regulator
MVWFDSNPVDVVFTAIADPTRRQMLDLLSRHERRELAVKDIGRPFKMSQPAISQQLRVLERAGLVSQRKQGRFRMYRIEPARLKAAYDWLEHYRAFWEERFARLGALLGTMPEPPDPSLPPSP